MTNPSIATGIASTLDDITSNMKNMSLIEYNDIHEQLNKWTIPSTIYKKGIFSFISSMTIKIVEQTLNIS